MNLKDQNQKIEEVISESRRVIARADEALLKYKGLVENSNIDPEKLMQYLKKNYGPNVEKDIDQAVNSLLDDIFIEADNIIQQNMNVKSNSKVHRRLRNLI